MNTLSGRRLHTARLTWKRWQYPHRRKYQQALGLLLRLKYQQALGLLLRLKYQPALGLLRQAGTLEEGALKGGTCQLGWPRAQAFVRGGPAPGRRGMQRDSGSCEMLACRCTVGEMMSHQQAV